jgi:hypothetical protein
MLIDFATELLGSGDASVTLDIDDDKRVFAGLSELQSFV